MKIILASASPRRCELMKLITEDFIILPSNIEEKIPDKILPNEAAEYLAVEKAKAITSDAELIIGCDTSVVIDEMILGKPKTENECRRMLKSLSGKTHIVYTGVAIIYNGKVNSFTEATEVEFYELSDLEIDKYIATREPFDKAGGYGIQGKGSILVKKINGDYFNVVGLPVSKLARALRNVIKEKVAM